MSNKLFANIFRIDSTNHLLLYFSLIFGLLSIIATVIKLSNVWLNNKIVASLISDLSIKIFQNTLNQPYNIHPQTNSSKVILNLCEENNLRVFDIRKNDINGASKQYFICHQNSKYKTNQILL